MALDAAVDADALQLYARLTADDAPPQLRLPVREALAAIQAALRLYGRERLLLSFNGGKDATVLLHLARAAYAHAGLPPPRCVYWDDSDCFPEVVAFVEGAAAQHRLPLVRYTCSFADGLHDAVERLGTAAVLLGTRTGDPNGVGADTFQPSSPGWPPFMRVNPLLRWSYHDVWRLLRGFGLPCCALYERGYTSLGNTTNTAPNPALLRDDGTHAAADALLSASLERGGRDGASGSHAREGLTLSVGLLRVSSAVLAGLASDELSPHAARRLRDCPRARLTRAEVVLDCATDVSAAVRALAARCDVVLVSGDNACAQDGGGSPAATGVARAFGLRLVPGAQPGAPALPEAAELLHDAADALQVLARLSIASSVVFLALGEPAALQAHEAGAVEAVCAYIDAAERPQLCVDPFSRQDG